MRRTGALNRIKYDNTDSRVMVPANLSGSTYNEGATLWQGAGALAILLMWIFVIMFFKDSYAARNKMNWVLVIGIMVFITQFILRFVIINEKYLMKQTQILQRSKNKVPIDQWEVLNIDDNGVIYYQDGRLGLILGAEQATVVGRDSSFLYQHYDAVSNFYKVLNQQGVQWTHFNAMISAKAENRLQACAQTVKDCPNSNIKKMCDMHLAHLRRIEVRTLYEREYWGIITKVTISKDRLLEIARLAVTELQAGAFNRCDILTREECYAFNEEISALDGFDATAIMTEKAQALIQTPIALASIIKVDTGELTEEQIKRINTSLALLADGSAYVETIDGISEFKIGKKLGNMINQRMQLIIKARQPFSTGDIIKRLLNINLTNPTTVQQQVVQPVVEVTPTEDEIKDDVIFFGHASETISTADDLKYEMEESKQRAYDVNSKLYTIKEQEAFNKKQFAAERKKQQELEEEKLLAAEEARRLAQEEEDRKKVSFDNFE